MNLRWRSGEDEADCHVSLKSTSLHAPASECGTRLQAWKDVRRIEVTQIQHKLIQTPTSFSTLFRIDDSAVMG